MTIIDSFLDTMNTYYYHFHCSAFGEKMSDRAVQVISTFEDSKKVLLDKLPVAFLVYDPDTTNTDESPIDSSGATAEEKEMEKYVQATQRTQVFGQVARRWQAQGSFGLLSPNSSSEEVAKFFAGSNIAIPKAFIARVEDGVPIKLYSGEEITSDSVSEFVKANNLPVVVELGGHNFRFAGRKGKPLAIGVYDPNDEIKTNTFRKELKEYAINGAHKDDYIFGTMDGKRWDKFLSQFAITKEHTPEVFILDVRVEMKTLTFTLSIFLLTGLLHQLDRFLGVHTGKIRRFQSLVGLRVSLKQSRRETLNRENKPLDKRTRLKNS